MNLIAMKVKLTRKTVKTGRNSFNVRNVYPDFNSLPPEVRTPAGYDEPMDWSSYLGKFGIGWFFDEVSGFGYADEVNPDPGVLYGVICMPQDFAEAAEEAFPELVELLEPEEHELWHEQRATAHEPETLISSEHLSGVLAGIQLARELGDAQAELELRELAEKALDANDPTPGRVTHHNKRVETVLARKGAKVLRLRPDRPGRRR